MSEAITISNDTKVQEESKFYTYDQLQAVIKRGGKGLPLNKVYDPKVFWDSMGEKFYKAFDRPEKCGFGIEYFIDRIKQLLPISSILEVGCGFGRLGPFLLQSKMCEKYTGVDISDSILKCSDEYLDPSVKEDADVKTLEGFFSGGAISDESKHLVGQEIQTVIESLKKKSIEKLTKVKPDYRSLINLISGDARKLPFDSDSFDCVITSEVFQHLSPEDVRDACMEILRVTKGPAVLLERWAFPGEHSEPHVWSHNFNEIFSDLGVDVLQITTVSQGLQGVVVRKR